MTRQNAILGVVEAIRAANGAGAYNFDLSPAHVTNSDMLTVEQRLRLTSRVSVGVWDGAQQNVLNELTSRREQAQMDAIVAVLIKDLSSETMVVQLNKLIADVARAIGQNPTLTGRAVLARIGVIDEPNYDPDKFYAYCTLHVGVQYDFDATTEI